MWQKSAFHKIIYTLEQGVLLEQASRLYRGQMLRYIAGPINILAADLLAILKPISTITEALDEEWWIRLQVDSVGS